MKRFIILVVFKDGANADVEYFYDANGALVKDLNKGISNIEYDILGNLKCITFSNGFKTKYIYDAAGYKLRTTHESAVTNTTDYISVILYSKMANWISISLMVVIALSIIIRIQLSIITRKTI